MAEKSRLTIDSHSTEFEVASTDNDDDDGDNYDDYNCDFVKPKTTNHTNVKTSSSTMLPLSSVHIQRDIDDDNKSQGGKSVDSDLTDLNYY